MDVVKSKWRKNVLNKAWERCKSLGQSKSKNLCTITCTTSNNINTLTKSKPYHTNNDDDHHHQDNKKKKCPDGCFSVYVGPEKQRFVVKTELANHPLFKMLLEDAEIEYGFTSDGPILLPCDVDLFYKVLAKMASGDEVDKVSPTWTSPFLVLCSPARRSFSHISTIDGINTKSYGEYRLLSPSRMLKLNQF